MCVCVCVCVCMNVYELVHMSKSECPYECKFVCVVIVSVFYISNLKLVSTYSAVDTNAYNTC